ncbi:MAG: methylmalonyl-CoA mutase family protein, partial [Halobacteria archaeon]
MFDPEELEKLRKDREEWEKETLDPWLEQHPERKERFATVSNREVYRLYTPDDVSELSYGELGFPGEPPYTRGIYPSMYRGRLWTMRQFAGYGTPEETNQRYHYLLERGQTGLSVAFDMPSLMGIDSDHKLSKGEVGKEGVAVDSLRDMEILFDGIPLDEVSVSFTINPSAPVIYGMYVALFDQRGTPREKVNATFQNDMLKEFTQRGVQVASPLTLGHKLELV